MYIQEMYRAASSLGSINARSDICNTMGDLKLSIRLVGK